MGTRRELARLRKAFGTWEKPPLRKKQYGRRPLTPRVYYHGYAPSWERFELTVRHGEFFTSGPTARFVGLTKGGAVFSPPKAKVAFVLRTGYHTRIYITAEE